MNSTATSEEYSTRVEQQIYQYENIINMHELPEAFHVWSHNYLRPALIEVFEVESIPEFYAKGFIAAAAGVAQPRFLSIGCGDGWLEIAVSKIMREKGIDFEFIAADLSPIMLDRFSASIPEELVGRLKPTEHDLNAISIEGRFNGVMANHSLHHFVELELIFDYIKKRLDGVFITNDMIGRNGHMRWPETLAIVRTLWPLLSDSQRVSAQMLRYEDRYVNHDCSFEGFEGVRAQDILPLITQRFNTSKFVGVGGFIDIFIDRSFGHGFDMSKENDRAFVDVACKINDMMLDADMIKPTTIFGYFTNSAECTVSYRGRTPARSIRPPSVTPSWTAYYDSAD